MDAIIRRALTEADIPALVDLENAARVADEGDGARRSDENEIRGQLGHPLGTPELEAYSGFFDGDRLVASGLLLRGGTADPTHYMVADGFVHPDYRGRGVGTLMMRWMLELAPRVHERCFPGSPLELDVRTPASNTAACALFEAEGFTPLRRFKRMRRAIDGAPVPAVAPDGLEFGPVTPETGDAVLEVHLEAFRDHWRGTRTTREIWRDRLTAESTRLDLSFVLRDPAAAGRIAGYLVASENSARSRAVGAREAHFDIIGTRRDYRRRGVASALIARAVEAAAAQGYTSATLGVDAQSPTGALGVYERAGFRPVRAMVMYGRVLIPEGGTGDTAA